jgi:hypothetical protein
MPPYLALALYQGTTLVVPLEFVHFQRPGILLVPAPDFQSGGAGFQTRGNVRFIDGGL